MPSQDRPILILQMQRMGDMILCFPLLLWLARQYPGRPIWVVAEPMFFTELLPLSPKAVYFPWDGLDRVLKEKYSLVINLSHRDKAAWLAGQVRAEEKLGPVRAEDGSIYIRGDWQLYRAGLVRNNRHNRFHWADLNALDAVPPEFFRETAWPEPRFLGETHKTVALFLGASEQAKRPSARFWADLARGLLDKGFRPVFLGGPGEKDLGRQAADAVNGPVLNLSGKLSLSELVKICQTFGLFVTPDTGPMHLAAWAGTRVLNLSMGPVNAWETGPYQPGNVVMSARMSCANCWVCTRDDAPCREKFDPGRTVSVITRLMRGGPGAIKGLDPAKVKLATTSRSENGLYMLESPEGSGWAADLVGGMWRRFWLCKWGPAEGDPAEPWKLLAEKRPAVAESIARKALELGRRLKAGLGTGGEGGLPEDFWSAFPAALRPMSSYIHVYLQNNDFSRRAWRDSLALFEEFLSVIS